MNVEFRAEAVHFPEKEYINGIAVAVYISTNLIAHNCTYNVGKYD